MYLGAGIYLRPRRLEPGAVGGTGKQYHAGETEAAVRKGTGSLLFPILFMATLGCASGRHSLNGECKMDYCFKIENVPFIAQKKNFCGPASLAMVMNYYGVRISQDEIAKEIYEPGAEGTLSAQLVLYTLQKGFEAEMYNGNLDDLKEKIRADFPLIVSVKADSSDKTHYMVVWGYDDLDKRILAHSGRKERVVMGYDEFIDMWKRADFLTVWMYPKVREQQEKPIERNPGKTWGTPPG